MLATRNKVLDISSRKALTSKTTKIKNKVAYD